MKLNKKFIFSLHGLLFLIAFYLIQTYYPQIHPLSRTDFRIDQEEAVEKAKDLIKAEIPPEDMEIKTSFIVDKKYYEHSLNLDIIFKRMNIQPYQYWEISMISKENKKLGLSLGANKVESINDLTGKWYTVHLSPEGRLLEMDFEKPRLALFSDSTIRIPKSPQEGQIYGRRAQQEAIRFLQELVKDTATLTLVTREFKQDSLGLIFDFTFAETIQNQSVYHQVKLAAGKVLYYHLSFEEKMNSLIKDKDKSTRIVVGIMEGMIYLLLFVFLVIYLIRLLRKEAISFRIALPLVYFMAGITILQTVFEMWHSGTWIIAVGILPTTIFYSIGILFLYAISDATARQNWSDKVQVTDLLLQGRLFSPSAGMAVVRGIYLGVLSLAAFILPLIVFTKYLNGHLRIDEDLKYSLVLIFPIFTLTIKYLTKAIFNEYFFRLFGLSLFKKWLKKNIWLIIFGALLALVFSSDLEASNPLINLLFFIIPALLFAYFLVRFEIFTTIIGFFTFKMLSQATIFIHTGESFFQELGIGFFFILGSMIIVGIGIVLFKRKAPEITQKYIPDYVRKLEEKERLIRELEIARNVQQQFLPKYTPHLDGYQISAFCQPAWEVGGDYFDYFEIGDNKLGIVIGDVSNKGVSAAFFMTLVKGFLKALATYHQSPIDILTQTNQLFYRNVERGYFISMVFGILDGNTGEFTFARAGHNPILLLIGKSSEGQWFTPRGVGIGILPDQKFRQTIVEEKIRLETGDVLILYTDGYPEAMNESSVEFGEDNLQNIISQHKNEPPKEIIKRLEERIQQWEGKQPALDDRTIVVIKRLQ